MSWKNIRTLIIAPWFALPLVISWISIPGAATDAAQPQQDSILRGPYFGQEPPGLEPEIFAPGIVSTAAGEGCIVFSADGRRVVFRRFGLANVFLEGEDSENGWRIPRVPAPFTRLDWYNGDFTLAPDGRSFYFSSTRPIDAGAPEFEDSNIWVTRWDDSGWSEATPLPETIRSLSHAAYPTVTADGTLYLFSWDPEAADSDVYEAKQVAGTYREPENLGNPVSTEYGEYDPYVAPDGSYLIFASYQRPDGYGNGDFYISFREDDGSWSEPANMGEQINSPANENRPFVTLDGRFFFFTSDKVVHDPSLEELRADLRPGNGSRDIYWVDAKIIDRLRPTR
jgi:Tol biopolymer transport system component